MAYESYNTYKPSQDKLFDLKRQALRSEMDKLAKAGEKQTKARLASSGITDTSGLAQKQLQNVELDVKRNLYKGLGDIGMEQLQLEAGQGYDIAKLNIEDERKRKAREEELRQATYQQKGLLGEKMDPTQLEAMKTTDPSAYYSYIGGQAQKEIEKMKSIEQMRTKAYESLATQFDPESPSFKADLDNLLYDVSGGREGVKITSEASIEKKRQAMEQAKANLDAAARKENIWGQTYHDWNDPAAKEAEKVYNAAKLAYENALAGGK